MLDFNTAGVTEEAALTHYSPSITLEIRPSVLAHNLLPCEVEMRFLQPTPIGQGGKKSKSVKDSGRGGGGGLAGFVPLDDLVLSSGQSSAHVTSCHAFQVGCPLNPHHKIAKSHIVLLLL